MNRLVGAIVLLGLCISACAPERSAYMQTGPTPASACNDTTLLRLQKQPVASLTDREHAQLLMLQQACYNYNAAVMGGNISAAAVAAQTDFQANVVQTCLWIGVLSAIITVVLTQPKH